MRPHESICVWDPKKCVQKQLKGNLNREEDTMKNKYPFPTLVSLQIILEFLFVI